MARRLPGGAGNPAAVQVTDATLEPPDPVVTGARGVRTLRARSAASVNKGGRGLNKEFGRFSDKDSKLPRGSSAGGRALTFGRDGKPQLIRVGPGRGVA